MRAVKFPAETELERSSQLAMEFLKRSHPRSRFILVSAGTGEWDYLRIDRRLTPSHARMILEDAAKHAGRYGRKQKWSSVPGLPKVKARGPKGY